MSINRRRRDDGSYAYQVRVTVRGRRLPAQSFDTLKEARKREAELIGARRLNASNIKADEFAESWAENYPIVKTGPTRGRRKSEGTNETNRYYLKAFTEHFRGWRLEDLDRQMARRFAVAHPRSAAVARNVFSDALDDGLVEANPFAALHMEQSKGRKDHEALTEEEFCRLADVANEVHGSYGATFRALVLAAAYTGGRLNETLNLERDHIHGDEIRFKVAKFDKQRTVLLLPEAKRALESFVPLISTPYVFPSKRGLRLSATNHYALWNPVRHAFWQTLSEARRRAIVDLDWHSLRHAAGYHFYVTLGFTDEETAHQLGHSDAGLVRRLYGHGRQGVLERMKRKAAA